MLKPYTFRGIFFECFYLWILSLGSSLESNSNKQNANESNKQNKIKSLKATVGVDLIVKQANFIDFIKFFR